MAWVPKGMTASEYWQERKRGYNLRWHYARWYCAEVFGYMCAEEPKCTAHLEDLEHRQTWRLVPVTPEGERLLAAKGVSMIDKYEMDEDLLLDNFEALCRRHYQKWVEERENGVYKIATVPRAYWLEDEDEEADPQD